ncbi:MAG: hypothetical protein ABIP63_10240, partial [Thermoanaerobaculia bacterium]
MILLSPSRRVVLVNRSAESLLNQSDGLRLEKQRLRFTDPAANERFDRYVCEALNGTQSSPRGDWVLAVKRPSGAAPYQVVVSALPGLSSEETKGGFAVFIDDPAAVMRPGAGVLRILFHLTGAEERLAIG